MLDEKQSILTIAITTYNRVEFLKKNLLALEEIINKLDAINLVEILISDNCSTDGTSLLFETSRSVRVIYHRNKENIGPIKNIVNLFSIVKTQYMMLLGDDDYISKEYLQRVLECINEDIGCIVPSYVNVDLDGREIGRGRDVDCKPKRYEAGFNNCLENAWRGHQMSGLVFRVENIADELRKKQIDNWYPQIYPIAYCCLHGVTYHITEYPILVTRPPQKSKVWGYGSDGLIGDVFDNYVKLDITKWQKVKLEMKFLIDQYWRYAMYIKRGVGKFFGCIGSILKSPNTLWPTKLLFAISFGFILMGKAISLLLSGKLVKTLLTKVDI